MFPKCFKFTDGKKNFKTEKTLAKEEERWNELKHEGQNKIKIIIKWKAKTLSDTVKVESTGSPKCSIIKG